MKKLILFLCIIVFTQAESIRVGTGNSYKPFAYIDEKGEVSGFDIELLKLLSEIDSSLEFEFFPSSFNTLFVGLDSNKFDLLAHQLTKTSQREQKYIFSEPYFQVHLNFIFQAGASFTSFEDLKAKKIGVVLGSNQALKIEEFKAKNPSLELELVYFKNYGACFLALANKQIDALLDNPIVALDYAKALGVDIQISALSLQKTAVYFIFKKSQEKLRAKISKALKQAKAEGKLRALSLSYFNKDYTQD